MKKYDHITAPYSFKEFYSKYPQGYTIFEALLDWLDHVNSMTDQMNVTVDEWLNLKTFINEELKTYSNEQLQNWLDDGTLEQVINDALFESKADKTELDAIAAEKQTYFNTFFELYHSNKLELGMILKTYGFNSVDDEGGSFFVVKQKTLPLNVLQFDVSDPNLMVEITPVNKHINLKQLNVLENTDISTLLKSLNDLGVTSINLMGDYELNSEITLENPFELFNGSLKLNNLPFALICNNDTHVYDVVFNGMWNTSQVLRISNSRVKVHDCEFYNLNNSDRPQTVSAIHLNNCISEIYGNYIHDLTKQTSNAGFVSAVAILVSGDGHIYNNTIENILRTSETYEIADYDGIMTHGDLNSKIVIENNRITNVNGRFIKLQTHNVTIKNNKFIQNKEIMQNFIGIDAQYGNVSVHSNHFIFDLSDLQSSMVFQTNSRNGGYYSFFTNNLIEGNSAYFTVLSMNSMTKPFTALIENNIVKGYMNNIGLINGGLDKVLTHVFNNNVIENFDRVFTIRQIENTKWYLNLIFTNNTATTVKFGEVIPLQNGVPVDMFNNVFIKNNFNFNETAMMSPILSRCGSSCFIHRHSIDIVGAPEGFKRDVIVEGINHIAGDNSIVKLTKLSDGSSVIVETT